MTLIETSSTRTLKRALEHAGSLARLAERLQAPEAALQDWLDGAAAVPIRIYLEALDLVAQGPLSAPANRGFSNERP